MLDSPEFTVGGTLRRTGWILRHHAGLILGLAVAFYVPFGIAWSALATYVPAYVRTMAGEPSARTIGFVVLLGFLPIVVQIGATVLTAAAVVRVACDGFLGRPVSFGGGVGAALQRFFPVLALSIIMGICVSLASVLLMVPGIMLGCTWSVAIPARVVEGPGILASLGRSRGLTDGHRWPIFGFFLVMLLVNALVLAAASLPPLVMPAGTAGLPALIGLTVVATVTQAIVGAVYAVAVAAIYIELRRTGEGAMSAEVAAAFA